MDRRKELKLSYKEAGTPMGVCAVRNLADGKLLVERTMNTEGLLNRHRFTLKIGRHSNPALQADYTRLGEDAFAFEVLEVLDPKDLEGRDPKRALEALEDRWLAELRPYGELGYNKEKR